MRGRLIDISFGINRRQRITVEVDRDFRDDFERMKDADLDIEIKKHREKRSKTANAYFHLLLNKIAEARSLGNEEVKKLLVCEYGALAKDADGMTVGFKLPASVDVSAIYPYVKCFDTRTENGKLFNCYLVYKQTHDMDTKEMCRLIDGTIKEARELGIETDTPEQLARYQSYWMQQEHQRKDGTSCQTD